MDKIELRNRFGNVMAGNLKGPVADNLAIALCTYFDNDPEKPDEPEDDQLGWTPWVVQQVNATLDALVEESINYFMPPDENSCVCKKPDGSPLMECNECPR